MANKMRSKNPPEKKTSAALVSKGPPDGGWGWMVVFGSFMIHVVTDGVTYSFGVLYTEFIKVFGESKQATAWIASLLVGVTLCSGPIASIFVNKYGCRAVTIAGAILAGASLFASTYVNSISMLYITIGFGTGLGFGLIYLPAIVCVTCYFEKYRSLATGIAVCGSGLGTFIFAPLVDILIRHFEWRVTVKVISGLVFVCTLFGILFRALPADDDEDDDGGGGGGGGYDVGYDTAEQLQLDSVVVTVNGGGGAGASAAAVPDIVEPAAESEPLNSNSRSCDHIPAADDDGWRRRTRDMCDEPNGGGAFGGDLDKATKFKTLSQPELIAETSSRGSNGHLNPSQRNERSYASQNLKPMSNGIMYQKDIFYSGSMKNVGLNRRRTISQSTNAGNYVTDPTCNGTANDFSLEGACCSVDAKNTIKQMLDFTLLKDPIFILYTISNFLTSIGFNIPYLYLKPQAIYIGISDQDSSYLLSLLGIANTLGRIVLGFISDKPWINRLMVYIVCLTICGVATFLSAYCTDLFTLSLYTIIFGSTIGAYVGLTSVILVDLLGLDKLTNAFGILLLFQGIASLVGPPIAGWLYDVTGSYNPAFYLSGTNIAVSGLMLLVVPFIQSRCERNELGKMTAVASN